MKMNLARFANSIFSIQYFTKSLFKHAPDRLTDDGGVLRPVQRADDDEAEALVLLAVNEHVAGL